MNCEKDGNQLRVLLARGKEGGYLTETYLRWCDKCDTIYILKPENIRPEELLVPLLAYAGYSGLPQMEPGEIEL